MLCVFDETTSTIYQFLAIVVKPFEANPAKLYFNVTDAVS
jgi:hypothetical protein